MDVHRDQFVIIKVEGMHCHRCEQAIQRVLLAKPGVHEVEVDFLSGQASVLYDPDMSNVRELMDAVKSAGYRPSGFSQGRAPS